MTALEYAVAQLACQLGITLPDTRDLTVRFVDYTRQLAKQGAFRYADEEKPTVPPEKASRPVAEEIREAPQPAQAGDSGQARSAALAA